MIKKGKTCDERFKTQKSNVTTKAINNEKKNNSTKYNTEKQILSNLKPIKGNTYRKGVQFLRHMLRASCCL